MKAHRIETHIAGRCYPIEVARVAEHRWRAQLANIPGIPTALMPFYGRTPEEAAAHLTAWLTRAHQHVAPAGPVLTGAVSDRKAALPPPAGQQGKPAD